MSLECSECERDMRGPHDESCSRYVPPKMCVCGHDEYQHDEEEYCTECECIFRERRKP